MGRQAHAVDGDDDDGPFVAGTPGGEGQPDERIQINSTVINVAAQQNPIKHRRPQRAPS